MAVPGIPGAAGGGRLAVVLQDGEEKEWVKIGRKDRKGEWM